MALCCLCRACAPPDHRRKKKFHGASCNTAKQTLSALSEYPLDCLVETSDPSAILCHACERTLTTIHSLEAKVVSMKEDVKRLLSSLQIAGVVSLGKRSRPGYREPEVPPKRAHVAQSRASDSESVVQLHAAPSTSSQSVSACSSASPPLTIIVPYKAGPRKFQIRTPSRKKSISRITRKSYVSVASAVVNSPSTTASVVKKIAAKIKGEMKDLSSISYDSILTDSVEAIKQFSWELVYTELVKKVPTLMSLLSQLINKPKDHKPLLCCLASQILKCKHQRLCLVQRVISVMLYGYGTAKQVFTNMQPLNVCLSYSGTMKIIGNISADHDIDVQMWSDELVPKPPEETDAAPVPESTPVNLMDLYDTDSDSDSEIERPTYSPLSSGSSVEATSDYDGEDDDGDGDDGLSSNGDTTNDVSDGQEEDDDTEELETTVELAVAEQSTSEWFGYKFVGDNVDNEFKPAFQRADKRGLSMHYFNGFAARDRVNFSHLSDEPPPYRIPDANTLLPSAEDISTLKKELSTMVARILLQYFEGFSSENKAVPKHIPSKYSSEMAKKSKTVPLGILPYNENRLDEMTQIVAHYMKLVPTFAAEGHHTLPNGSTIDFDDSRFHSILFGGDQLTVARIRGTQTLRDTQERKVDRLEGVVPVCEDWHTRMTLLKVIWGRLYSNKSTKEKGTMYQLRNVINRTMVPPDPEKNMNAAEDFMLLLVHTHVIQAARVLQLKNPTSSAIKLSESVISEFIHLPRLSSTTRSECDDGVYMYAKELLTLGLLWHGFHDTNRESDGERILRYWKFLLIVFKSTNHRNYAKESVNVLCQYYYKFSERQKAQLLWSRCVNTRGYAGANIPCDLHMEHLNRRLKTIIRGMGSNISPSRIQKASRSLAAVQRVCDTFERETVKSMHSDHHPYPSFGKDFRTVLSILEDENVFEHVPGRKHASFSFNCGLLETVKREELVKKVQRSISQISL